MSELTPDEQMWADWFEIDRKERLARQRLIAECPLFVEAFSYSMPSAERIRRHGVNLNKQAAEHPTGEGLREHIRRKIEVKWQQYNDILHARLELEDLVGKYIGQQGE